MPLFEVAIIQQPTKKEVDEGTGQEKLIFAPKAVIAKDAQTAGLVALKGEASLADLDLSRAQVLVRPFG